jgi:hypothetical protein
MLDSIKGLFADGPLGDKNTRQMIGLQMLANSGPTVGAPGNLFAGMPQAVMAGKQLSEKQREKMQEEERRRNIAKALIGMQQGGRFQGIDPALIESDPTMAMKLDEYMNPVQKPAAPSSTVGKIMSDFNAGLYGEGPKAAEIRDAAIQKAIQGSGMEMISDGNGGFTFRQGSGIGMSNQDVKNEANSIDATRTAAATATDLKQTVKMLRRANENTGYSGPGGGIIGTGLDLAEKAGIDAPGDPGSRAQMRSGGLDVALAKVQQTKGAISNAEMTLFMAASPGMQQTQEGNAALLDMIDAIADRQIERVQKMEEWRAQKGTLSGFEAEWARYIESNPIVTEDKILGAGGSGANDIDSLVDKWGN